MAYTKSGNFSSIAPQGLDKLSRRLELRREAQNKFASDKLFFWAFITCLVSTLLGSSLILVSWDKLPPQIPLYYLHPWGETRLASPIELWILPILIVGFSMLNFALALMVDQGNKFITRILIVTNGVIAIGVLFDTLKIISLII